MPDEPHFVINATNVQSGVLWRFSKRYMRDWGVGEVNSPKVSLARAVAVALPLPCLRERTRELAETPTRLKHLSDEQQQRLINWGDAALRAHPDAPAAPEEFPVPASGCVTMRPTGGCLERRMQCSG